VRAVLALVCLAAFPPASAAAQEAAPEPLTRVAPQYPAEAEAYRVAAACRAKFDLTPAGAPTDICVRCDAPAVPQAFEREAGDALRQWRYPRERAVGPQTRRENLIVAIPFVLREHPWPSAAAEPVSAPVCGESGGVS
jgi:outer membrane biosynthesis protein TonB